MSVVLEIADAVVDSLSGGSFSETFTPERRYLPVYSVPRGEVDTIRVSVIPASVDYEAASRHADFVQVSVSIVIERKVSTEDQTDLDAMAVLVEEVRSHLARNVLPSSPGAKWIRASIDPLFDPEQLSKMGVFSSAQTVTYQVI